MELAILIDAWNTIGDTGGFVLVAAIVAIVAVMFFPWKRKE